MDCPTHFGPLLDAVGTGKAFMVTVVVVVDEQPEALVTDSVYVPAIAAVAVADTVGLWLVLVKPLGPVQE